MTGWIVAGILFTAGALERWRSVRADRRVLDRLGDLDHALAELRGAVMGELHADATWQDMVWMLREERHYQNNVAHLTLLKVEELCINAGLDVPRLPDRDTHRRLYFETHRKP